MRKIKILLLIVAAVVGIAAVSRMMFKPVMTHEAERANNEPIVTPGLKKHPIPSPVADAPILTPSQTEQVGIFDKAPPQEAKLDGGVKVAPASTQTSTPKEPLRDPEARAALSLVGVDPDAEAYWLGAIFDSSLPENEREDLMEDLNEEGLSDAKHPGPQDLPVILNRLVIIEEILPFANDFMVEHLGEAYKDLVNLARITQGGGEPVR